MTFLPDVTKEENEMTKQQNTSQEDEHLEHHQPIDPLEMLERLEDPDYVAFVESEFEHRETQKPNVEAILAGIRFIHDFARTPQGETAAKAAIEAGFFEVVPIEDGIALAVPRFIWPDSVYDSVFPGHSFDVGCRVAAGRHLLWGKEDYFDQVPSKGAPLKEAILLAIRRYRKQRVH
jgi:hypothetical protein